MNENSEPAGGGEQLQFDHVEITGTPEQPGMVCTGCQRAITESYFQINGRLACPACTQTLQAALAGGSGLKRTIKALAAGGLAGLVGMGIYYGVTAVTGLEIGLIAIVVGLLVGGAVRKGSEGRGGWYYQMVAIVLTYLAIAGSYSIFVVQAIVAHERSQPAVESATTGQPADTRPASGAESVPGESADGGADSTSGRPRSMRRFVLAVLTLVGYLLLLPVYPGVQTFIGYLIVGFALYEAWKINKTPALSVAGPFWAEPPETPDVSPGAPAPPGHFSP